jgi:hypothetical protein
MSADEFHVKRAKAIGDGDNDSIVIALDVEHNATIFQNAGAAVLRFDLRGLSPVCLMNFVYPCFQGLLTIRVFAPELAQNF